MTYDDDEFMVSSAVRQVARRAIAHKLEFDPPQWEDYPEVGEHDWERIEAEVKRIAEQFEGQTEKYDAAYRFLSERAGGES